MIQSYRKNIPHTNTHNCKENIEVRDHVTLNF